MCLYDYFYKHLHYKNLPLLSYNYYDQCLFFVPTYNLNYLPSQSSFLIHFQSHQKKNHFVILVLHRLP